VVLDGVVVAKYVMVIELNLTLAPLHMWRGENNRHRVINPTVAPPQSASKMDSERINH
jgi:hypothetical protein